MWNWYPFVDDGWGKNRDGFDTIAWIADQVRAWSEWWSLRRAIEIGSFTWYVVVSAALVIARAVPPARLEELMTTVAASGPTLIMSARWVSAS